MKLVKNWQRIALRSHSMWAGYLGVLGLTMPELLYLVTGTDTASPQLWWFMGITFVIYGLIGRIKDQGIGGEE